MAEVRIQESASWRLDEIHRYTRERWGVQQADRYIIGLFEAFEGIETRETLSRPIPVAFGIDGFKPLIRKPPWTSAALHGLQ